MTMLINGEAMQSVSAEDRGLQYGDGLFETLAVANGKPLLWRQHMTRLRRGCERLALPAPDEVRLRREALEVSQGRQHGVLKITYTRGAGGRGYSPADAGPATRIVQSFPWPDYPNHYASDGIAAIVCDTRLSRNPALAGIKHLNRLEQILARSEWDTPDIAEGLMLDTEGCVIEGTAANVFVVKEGVAATPDLTQCGVEGIMRALVLEHLDRLGIPCEVRAMGLEAVKSADEIFLTNSLIGVWPVRRLTDRTYPIGPITRQVVATLNEVVREVDAQNCV